MNLQGRNARRGLVALGLVAAAVAGGAAWAIAPPSTTIRACANRSTGALRVITGSNRCVARRERAVT